MNLNRILVTLCCGLALFAACKKKNDDNRTARRKALEEGKWQISAYIATVNYMGADTTMDMYAIIDACDKDDFLLFANNGTGIIHENSNKCSDDQQVENFTWALLSSDSKLALLDANPDTADVLELTSTQMKLKFISINSFGEPITGIVTYKNIK